MIKLVVLLLQIAKQVFTLVERRRLIAEGERQQIAKQLEAIATAAKMSQAIRAEIKAMTDDEIDAALRGDYRD